jgi:hypothetical protein
MTSCKNGYLRLAISFYSVLFRLSTRIGMVHSAPELKAFLRGLCDLAVIWVSARPGIVRILNRKGRKARKEKPHLQFSA